MNKYEEALNNIHKHGKTMTWDDAGAIIEALNFMINKTSNTDENKKEGVYPYMFGCGDMCPNDP